MVRTVKIGILFASTSLLVLMGGNGVMANSIEDQKNITLTEKEKDEILEAKKSYSKKYGKEGQENITLTEKEKEIMLAWKKVDVRYKELLRKAIQNQNEISEEDSKNFVDELNQYFNKIADKYGRTDQGDQGDLTQEQFRSNLKRDIEDIRKNPSKLKELQESIGKDEK
ncbi:hypothetical protein [Pasteuria penetrans]|uniref:hypothetical protein n=1 Tax=Pasteuria penetrans TaxID=86005 RepID=UPI0011EE09BE|nr:hypothetical protein [Pasteuria penetrans]